MRLKSQKAIAEKIKQTTIMPIKANGCSAHGRSTFIPYSEATNVGSIRIIEIR